jgi:serine/threonine protein kinase/Tfp pilus assembly protein PilF
MTESMRREWLALRDSFDELVDLGDAERRARLDEIGAQDAHLRARLEAMLAVDADAPERLLPFEEGVARAILAGGEDPDAVLDREGRIGSRIGRYRVEGLVGAGGMGVLYRARDARLERPVAIKLLPQDLTRDPRARQRFLREARAASSLDHPNVCTIYEADETEEGDLYIAMAFYEGESLRARLARAPLDVAAALEVLAQAARGLAAAHARGLVHRDVKPENLLVTSDGTLKILDFGIAKTPDPGVTLPDQRPGTGAYMAPEQARGDAVDGKADVWSLGIVLHEMLTGERPDVGMPFGFPMTTMLGKGVPGSVQELVARMLSADPRDRPTAAEIATDPGAVSAPGALGDAPAVRAIAVLPLADLSEDANQGHLCEGMAEELLHALARVEGLRVASRLSSPRPGERPGDARVIGRSLDVDTLIEGSVRKSGSSIRVAVRLVRVSDGSLLWSERYDEELVDVFAIQEDIARSVVRALRLTLGGPPLASLRAARTEHVEAYEHYLKGRRFFLRDTHRDLEAARRMFERAIEIDPDYPRAWAGLSDACAFLYKHFDRDATLLDAADHASRRAVELDRTSGDAHTSRAVVHWLREDLAGAEAAFAEAVRLEPDSFEAHYLHGMCCYSTGGYERALAGFTTAWALRTDDFQSPNLIGALLRASGREREARASFQRGLELVERHLALNPENVRARYHGALALVGTGRVPEGLEWAGSALAMAPGDAMVLYNVAAVHALAGRADEALGYLERAIDAGFAHGPDLRHDPDLETLRSDPRLRSLIARLG